LTPLVRERERIQAFGSFDPAALRELQSRGLFVKLYQMAARQLPQLPEGAVAVRLGEDKSGICFAVLSRKDVHLEIPDVRWPDQSLDAIRRRIAEIEGGLARNAEALRSCTGDYWIVAEKVEEAEDRVRFFEARAGMGEADRVAYIQGYCPEPLLEMISGEAAERKWAVLIREPGAGEPVPTVIQNPKWVQPIKSLFDMIGILPGYEEIDISAVFLLFLSLFFAILVGDAGYGALFLGLTLWARRKFPRAASAPFALLKIMSICTIVWGVVTGAYFGIGNLPAPLRGLKIDWLGSDQHIMLLCFIIGATHLTVAHVWNAIRGINSLQALGQVGWICTTWTMFFTARTMVLGEAFPPFMLCVFFAGVLLIVLFMTPVRNLKTEWFNHVMLPLSLVSNFVDVVSYLRLFAVGTASFAVASAFNEMAIGGMHGVLSGLLGALILFGGHALNIILSAMGVLVHGVRLNTLEFSSHVGMQWTGLPYRPFQRARGLAMKE
jgi:V/A-type H+-transporting ATPase subunit I